MSERLHGLVQLLPDKTDLEDCSLEELQHLTKRFPYFAPAQFLLLQKLKETGSPDYENQHRKTFLYFHDPLLFDYFISSEKYEMDEAAFENGVSENANTTLHQQLDAVLPPAELLAESDHPVYATEQTDLAISPDVERASEFGLLHKNREPNKVELLSPAQSLPAEAPVLTENDPVENKGEVETAEPAVQPDLPLQANKQTEVAEEVMVEPEKEIEESAASQFPAVVPVALGPAIEKETARLQAEPLPITVAPAPVPSEAPTAEPLAFEPFHTVDYFASQGIKISSDALPKDKLSKQLRSFTEWLKVMKRLPAAEIETASPTTAEKTVESLASDSVEGGDVVTEAMAEVWARQGNKRKAIETYNKLSLQNPSRKAYFAAKIENLSAT